jgi:acyl-coenzyme A thioesterase PaaI-like protein
MEVSMEHLNNPYAQLAGFGCFGCSPHNLYGLRLEFCEEGEEIVAAFAPRPEYAGYFGVLHGGIQATAHDEIASWVVFVKCRTAGWTSSLHVEYRSPVLIEKGPLTLRARLDRMDGNTAIIQTKLFDGTGALGSEAEARYFTVPEHIAKRRFRYPGYEAFVSSA